MNNEINETASIIRQRLLNDDIVTSLIEKMQNALNSGITLNDKCHILNGLGIIYFLYPNNFKNLEDQKMQIVRNPIDRFHFLTSVNICDEESLCDFNYKIDDKYTYITNSETFENTNFPFLMSYDQEGWSIKRISPGSVYFYNISKTKDDWKILSCKHGHNPFNFENHLLSILSEFLDKANI